MTACLYARFILAVTVMIQTLNSSKITNTRGLKREREPFASLSPNKKCQLTQSFTANVSMQPASPERQAVAVSAMVACDGTVVHGNVHHGSTGEAAEKAPTAANARQLQPRKCVRESHLVKSLGRAAGDDAAAGSKHSLRRSMLPGKWSAADASRPASALLAGSVRQAATALHCFEGSQARHIFGEAPLGPFLPPRCLGAHTCKRSSPATPGPCSPMASPAAAANAATDAEHARPLARKEDGSRATPCPADSAHPSTLDGSASDSQSSGDENENEPAAYVVDEQDAVRPAAKQDCRSVDLGRGCSDLGVACFEAAMPWWFTSTSQRVVG